MDWHRAVGTLLVAGVVVVVASGVPVAYPLERPLPDRPTAVTEQSALEYAETYELAYTWNEEVDGPFDHVALTIRNASATAVRDGIRVHLEIGVTERTPFAVDAGRYTAEYLVNATTTMRAETAGRERPGPDPRNGTVVTG